LVIIVWMTAVYASICFNSLALTAWWRPPIYARTELIAKACKQPPSILKFISLFFFFSEVFLTCIGQIKFISHLTLDIKTGSLLPSLGIRYGGISQSSVFKTQPICWQASAADSIVQPKLQTVPQVFSILTWN
jgi:hypothetical protein